MTVFESRRPEVASIGALKGQDGPEISKLARSFNTLSSSADERRGFFEDLPTAGKRRPNLLTRIEAGFVTAGLA